MCSPSAELAKTDWLISKWMRRKQWPGSNTDWPGQGLAGQRRGMPPKPRFPWKPGSAAGPPLSLPQAHLTPHPLGWPCLAPKTPPVAVGVPGKRHQGQLGDRAVPGCHYGQMRFGSTLKVKAVKKNSLSEDQVFTLETFSQNTKTLG